MSEQRLSRVDELNNIGSKYYGEGKVEPARLHFLAALSIDPNHASALQNLSAVLFSLEKYHAAVSVARRALVACGEGPTKPYVQGNMGSSLVGLRRFAEGQRLLRDMIRQVPGNAFAHHNLGLVLYMTGQLNEAFSAFSKALDLMPDSPMMKSDRAMSLLALGEIPRGLEAYEVRWEKLHKSRVWDLGVPEWQGESVTNKKILVHHEQGFGDTLMLCRFVNKLLEFNPSEITLAVPKELVRLLQQSFSFAIVKDWDDESIGADFDYHTPLLSTMRWLNIDIDSNFLRTPYVFASESDASSSLPEAPCRVGICWASGDHGPLLRRRRRTVPLEQLLGLTEINGVRVVSLQKGDESNDIVRIGAEGLVFDPMARCEDFADTASVVAKLDLVISVDSAVIHLAGAMGKPAIMLGPYTRCWRWWDQKSCLPWYDNMRHLRQSANGNWDTATTTMMALVRQATQKMQQIQHQPHQRSIQNGDDH